VFASKLFQTQMGNVVLRRFLLIIIRDLHM